MENEYPTEAVQKLIDVICQCRFGAMDDKQFKATVEHIIEEAQEIGIQKELHRELRTAQDKASYKWDEVSRTTPFGVIGPEDVDLRCNQCKLENSTGLCDRKDCSLYKTPNL